MNLKTMLSSLVPHFERDRIIEDIDSLAADLESNLIPAYNAAVKAFQGQKLASNAGRTMEAMFHLRYPQERGETHISHTLATLVNSLETIKLLEKVVLDIFNRDVTKDSLTYKKAAVLQFLAAVRFYNDYAGRHLNRMLAAEDAALKSKTEDVDLLPFEQKYLQENLETFLQTGHVLSTPTGQVAEKLGQMQDLQIVADKINSVTATLGQDHVDPFRLGFIGPNATSSPIYKARAYLANYHVSNHQRNQELAKAIQLRLFALKDARASRNDPKLEQQIASCQERLQRLNQDIADFQERYG